MKERTLTQPRTTPPSAPEPTVGLPPSVMASMVDEQGRPRLIPGSPILTKKEKEVLTEYGWKEGAPIPANFASLLAQAAAAPTKTEAAEFLTGALRGAEQLSSMPPPPQSKSAFIPDAGPGVNDAINAALIKDDLPTQKAPPPEPHRESAPEDSGAGGVAPPPSTCQHCGSDPNTAAPEATEEDKLRWVVAQEGMLRFEKEYQLYGGRIIVHFRSLLSEETDLVWKQLALDNVRRAENREPTGVDTLWANRMTYLMCMGVSRIETATAGAINIPPIFEMFEEKMDTPGKPTRLEKALEIVTKGVFPTDNLRRALGKLFHQFGLLVEQLEARCDDPSFWPAVGTNA